jgi:flagellar biosynthesis/type III secretory pathway chaperone
MLNKNLIITVRDQDKEDVLDIKSTNTRDNLVLEFRVGPKVAMSVSELKEALLELEKFNKENPAKLEDQVASNNIFQVENGVDNDE